MTDISRQAVEKIARDLEHPPMAMRPTITTGRKGADTLMALLARVEELEHVQEAVTPARIAQSQHIGYLRGLEVARGIADKESNEMRNGTFADIYSKSYANNVDSVSEAIQSLIKEAQDNG